MTATKKERLKFYVLIVLIVVSLLQVGILWNYQNYGLPINFFGKSNTASKVSDNYIKENSILPYRIFVCDADIDSKWMLGNENDETYIKLWNEAKIYLKSILAGGRTQTVLSKDDWRKENINDERSFMFEFKTGVQTNIFNWALSVESNASEGSFKVSRLVIAPWKNFGTLYIVNSEKTYAYNINISEEKLKNYEEIFKNLQTAQEKSTRDYTFIEELNLGSKYKITLNPDIAVILKDPQYSRIRNIQYSVPETITGKEGYTSSQVDNIAEAILGVEKDGYDRTVDSSTDTIEFRTQSKVYKLDKSGFLEYKYLPESSEPEKGDLTEAFVLANKLLMRIKALIPEDTRLYISGMDEKAKGSYIFTFDYITDGIPVTIDYKINGETIKHAVIIEATSRNILKCTALIRNFVPEKTEGLYNVYFGDLLEYMTRNYKELINNKNAEINDIRISYKAGGISPAGKLEPVWVVETADKDYIVPMHSK